MKLQCFAILLAFTLFTPTLCGPKPMKVNVNDKSAEIYDATTLAAPEKSVTNPPDSPAPTGITIPENPTTLPKDVSTTPVPPVPTTHPTSTQTPSTTPTTTPLPSPTTNATTTTSTTVKPTEAPSNPTEPPTPLPTPSPHSKGRQFDGPSFIGGIVLACGLTAIGFVAFKFYKARTERNYHTFYDSEL